MRKTIRQTQTVGILFVLTKSINYINTEMLKAKKEKHNANLTPQNWCYYTNIKDFKAETLHHIYRKF